MGGGVFSMDTDEARRSIYAGYLCGSELGAVKRAIMETQMKISKMAQTITLLGYTGDMLKMLQDVLAGNQQQLEELQQREKELMAELYSDNTGEV
jgi:hypothetical protein